VLLKSILDKMPEATLAPEEKALKERLSDLPEVTILNLIYQKSNYEGMANDFEFSAASMRDHWQAGYRDTTLTIGHKEWLSMKGPAFGVVMHDIHRPNESPLRQVPGVAAGKNTGANALP